MLLRLLGRYEPYAGVFANGHRVRAFHSILDAWVRSESLDGMILAPGSKGHFTSTAYVEIEAAR